MHTAHLRSWSYAVLTGMLLLAGLQAHAADDMAWNLILPPSPDGSHSGRILVTPAGHWHEGPGHTGQPEAAYHFHPHDEHTGGLGPGVPVRQDGELLGQVTGLPSQPQSTATLKQQWWLVTGSRWLRRSRCRTSH